MAADAAGAGRPRPGGVETANFSGTVTPRLVHAAWHWRFDVATALCLITLIYLCGWAGLRRRNVPGAASALRLAAWTGGWAVVAVALLSPLDVFQTAFVSVHMIQHELLMVVAPPLILLGRPMAVTLWGLPRRVRCWVGRLLRPRAALRRIFHLVTRPPAAWGISTAVLWAWHVPAVYDAVETNGLLHNIQHVCFSAAGLLFWWPVVGAPPFAGRLSLPLRAGYLIAGMTQRSLLGALITLSDRVLYPYYAEVLRSGPTLALRDQRIAGAIMWFGSGIVLLAVTLIVLWHAPEESIAPAIRSGPPDLRSPDHALPPRPRRSAGPGARSTVSESG